MSAATVERLRRAVMVLAACWTVALAIAFVSRVGFPLELEWMEGGSLQHALRIRRGLAVYPPPSAEFVPFLYTPLYPIVLAGLGTVVPIDFVLARTVSILATAAVGAALWFGVAREGKPVAHRAAAVGLLLAGYVFTFRWMDLARADALALAFLAWGLVVLRDAWGDARKAVLAGVLVALSFWTKQTAAVFVVASAVAGLLVAPRQLWIYAATIAVICGGGLALASSASDGWAFTYVFELHQSHAFNRERFLLKSWKMLAHAAPLIVLELLWIAALWARPLASARRRFEGGRAGSLVARLQAHRGTVYWGVLAVAGLIASALGYSTQWAEPNAFLPGVTFAALFVAVTIPLGGAGEAVALALIGGQLLFALAIEPVFQPIQRDGLAALGRSYRLQDPTRTIPRAEQRRRATELRARIEKSGGEVLALHRPYWSMLAGGAGHVGAMGLHDVPAATGHEIERRVRERVERGDPVLVVTEGEPPPWLRGALARAYRLIDRLHGDERVLPITGFMSEVGMSEPWDHDQLFFSPIAPAVPPAGWRVLVDFEDGTLQGFSATGAAFAGRPTRGVGSVVSVGPQGGELLLSGMSGREGLAAVGQVRSASIDLADVSALRVAVGAVGSRAGLRVEVVEDGGVDRVQPLELPERNFLLTEVMWEVPGAWRGARAYLRFVDDARAGALFVDDLWVRSP